MTQHLATASTGGHDLRPHPDPVLARKGWLRCYNCHREVHGSERDERELCPSPIVEHDPRD